MVKRFLCSATVVLGLAGCGAPTAAPPLAITPDGGLPQASGTDRSTGTVDALINAPPTNAAASTIEIEVLPDPSGAAQTPPLATPEQAPAPSLPPPPVIAPRPEIEGAITDWAPDAPADASPRPTGLPSPEDDTDSPMAITPMAPSPFSPMLTAPPPPTQDLMIGMAGEQRRGTFIDRAARTAAAAEACGIDTTPLFHLVDGFAEGQDAAATDIRARFQLALARDRVLKTSCALEDRDKVRADMAAMAAETSTP